MIGRLRKVLSGRSRSKDVAKERLRFVLMQDRASLSPELLESLKEEIVQAISQYVDIDRTGMEVELNRQGEAIALVANIPLRGVRGGRRRRGGRR